LVFKEDGQEYATVEKMLGNGMVAVNCADGNKRIGHIRGAMRKKVWYTLSIDVLGLMLET
jgi:translation initiation factor 1A